MHHSEKFLIDLDNTDSETSEEDEDCFGIKEN